MKKGQININYKERRLGFSGENRLVGQADRYSTIGYDAIVAYAAKAAAVPESSIEMSMEALFDAMNYFVLNGHSVQIPNLGTFSIGVRVKTTETEAEFTNNFDRNLRGVQIYFLPDSSLKSMIASTSISTSLNDEDYEGTGVIAISSALMGAAGLLFPMNAGRVYTLELISRAVFNGTRLSTKYLPAGSVHVTFLDSAGAEHPLALAGQYISQTYNSLVVNFKRVAENYPAFVAIKKIEIKNGEEVYFTKEFAALVEETPAISAINIDGKPVAADSTYPFQEGKQVKITALVAESTYVDEVSIGGVAQTPSQIGEGKIVILYTPAASGNAPLSVKANETAPDVYNFSFGQEGGTSVVAVTANGDPLNNGSITNIQAGQNYAVQVLGYGLSELTAANFELPSGTTIEIVSQSATQISANILNAQNGDFKIVVNDVIIFSAALVAVTPGTTVTGWKLTPSGATQQLSTAIDSDGETGAFGCFLVGENIDELTAADFLADSGISGLTYDAQTGELGGIAISGSHSIQVRSDNTTIATLTVTGPTPQGGDGLDKD